MWCCLVDYLTKWVEAFVIPDQRAKTIATLFVEHVVCRHGVPRGTDIGWEQISSLI